MQHLLHRSFLPCREMVLHKARKRHEKGDSHNPYRRCSQTQQEPGTPLCGPQERPSVGLQPSCRSPAPAELCSADGNRGRGRAEQSGEKGWALLCFCPSSPSLHGTPRPSSRVPAAQRLPRPQNAPCHPHRPVTLLPFALLSLLNKDY